MVSQAVHQSPPFAVVSPNDHTAWIIIGTSIGIPIVLVFGAIRLAVRRTANLGLDDALIAGSTVSSPDMHSMAAGTNGWNRLLPCYKLPLCLEPARMVLEDLLTRSRSAHWRSYSK